jgi:dTDP-4-amino-4,6-dideoxygalactose transaminase
MFATKVDKNKRNKIIQELKSRGIDSNIHYPYSLSQLKIFNQNKKKLRHL